MSIALDHKQAITRQLEDLSPELIEEVIDFIEFLKIKRMKKDRVDSNSLLLQQNSLSRIWDSEAEDLYEL